MLHGLDNLFWYCWRCLCSVYAPFCCFSRCLCFWAPIIIIGTPFSMFFLPLDDLLIWCMTFSRVPCVDWLRCMSTVNIPEDQCTLAAFWAPFLHVVYVGVLSFSIPATALQTWSELSRFTLPCEMQRSKAFSTPIVYRNQKLSQTFPHRFGSEETQAPDDASKSMPTAPTLCHDDYSTPAMIYNTSSIFESPSPAAAAAATVATEVEEAISRPATSSSMKQPKPAKASSSVRA